LLQHSANHWFTPGFAIAAGTRRRGLKSSRFRLSFIAALATNARIVEILQNLYEVMQFLFQTTRRCLLP
jgi:hypothetical protein